MFPFHSLELQSIIISFFFSLSLSLSLIYVT